MFRTTAQMDAASTDMRVLDECGVPYELLETEGCVAVEPALARVRHKIAGGLRLPLDETGDCLKFTQSLAEQSAESGVQFHHGVTIHRLVADGQRFTRVETEDGDIKADAFVVALGSYSPLLLRPLGIDVPVYPVKGYSITVPITDPEGAPVSTIMDESHKVAVTRLGDRIRGAGMAELGGYDLSLPSKRRKTVEHVVTDLFPAGGDVNRADFWTGLRPMTPIGMPGVGATVYGNLYLNTGHGTLGWTMSCGSGRLLADVMSGSRPDIGVDDLAVGRYRAKSCEQRTTLRPTWGTRPAATARTA